MHMKLRRLNVWLLGLLTAIFATGCFYPYESGMLLSRDLDALQKSMRETRSNVESRGVKLEEQSDKLTSQIRQADDKLAEVAETLDTLNRAARLSNADFGVQLERMLQELQELRGAIELADYRISRMEQQIASKSVEPAPSTAVAQAQPSTPKSSPKAEKPKATKPAAPVKNTPVKTAAKPASTKPKTPKEQIAHAKTLIRQNKFDQARGILRQILNEAPREAGVHDLAHYELGKTYQGEKKYRAALQEYIKVAEQFPKGTMVDDAYFQIGNCSMALGNLEEAEVFFNEIITNHKRSPFAKDAKAKLSEVKKRLKAEKTRG